MKTINNKIGGEGLRLCLGVLCMGEKLFMSKNVFNRICDSCKVAYDNYAERDDYRIRLDKKIAWREHF